MRSQAWGSVCLLVAGISAIVLLTLPFGYSADQPANPVGDPVEARIQAALDMEIDFECLDNPLSDVADHLAQSLGIDVLLDRKALEDFGIDTDIPITKKLTGISTRSALRLILNDLDLTYMIRDRALWITTPEEAEWRLITRVYNVGDIVNAAGVVEERGNDQSTLAETIMYIFDPDSWDDVGGPGSIEAIYGSLVISQTHGVHEEIESLLAAYRDLMKADQSVNGAGLQSIIVGQERHGALHEALDKPITILLRDTPLSEAMEAIGEKQQVTVMVDNRALEEIGLDPKTPVDGKFAEMPLRFVLKRLLHELDLTYTIRDEVIRVTTPEECEAQLLHGLYTVRDLVQLASPDQTSVDAGSFDFDSLIQVITTTIQPDSWDEVGGPGAIDSLLPAPTLVIAQTQDAHEQISELLVTLLAAKQREDARREEVFDPDQITLRAYHLHQTGFVDPAAVIKIILRDTDDEMWSDGKKTFIEPLGQTIVLKHNAPTHARVRKLLKELGVWHPDRAIGGKGYGNGGGFQGVGGATGGGMGGAAAPAPAAAPQGGGGFF